MSLTRFQALVPQLPKSIYRAKGFLWLDAMPHQRVVLQLVGKRSSLEAIGPWPHEPQNRLVFIGRHHDTDFRALEAALEACLG